MSRPKVEGKRYDTNGFYYALMYRATKRCKPHIVAIYPRASEANREARRINSEPFWGKDGWKHWTTQRFKFFFRGTIIDAYVHEFQRNEK